LLVDRDGRVEDRAAELGSACAHCHADVTEVAELRRAADRAVTGFGAVHHVVFAAGIGSGTAGFPFWNSSAEEWRRVLDVNLIGAANCANVFAPLLIQREGNTLPFLASVAGQTGSQTDPPYSALKAGLINFMQCVARDFAPHGARANALSPGMVRSSLNRSVWSALQQNLPDPERQDYETWSREKIERIAPLGRWQEPGEFGAMAVFLASPHARNITGQTLNIDGGQVMHS